MPTSIPPAFWRRAMLCLGVCLMTFSLMSSVAWSQGTPQTTPPDLIRLNNGAMYRGTIIESVPGSHTTVTLSTGEQKRFEASEITYAGPDKPQEPTALRVPNPNQARFRFESLSGQTLTLHIRTRSAVAASYNGTAIAIEHTRLCTAPCNAVLPPGKHKLAVSIDDAFPIPVEGFVDIEDGAVLETTYTSNSSYRWVGAGIMTASFLGGLAFMLSPLFSAGDEDFDLTPIWIGGGVMLVGGVVGGVISIGDDVNIQARPSP